MKYMQAIVGLLALCAVAAQCSYLMRIDHGVTNIQPLTSALYVLFFWILWGYARISDFLNPVILLSKGAVRVIAAIAAILLLLTSFAIASSSPTAQLAMVNFGALNAALVACYLFVAMVALFGDQWLGPIAKLLKFGRKFPVKQTT